MSYGKLRGRATTPMKTPWPDFARSFLKIRPKSEEIKKTKPERVFTVAKDEHAAAKKDAQNF